MDAWQDISRCIGTVDTCDKLRKYVITWEYSRTEILDIRVDIGDYKKNSHSHHQVKDQLKIFPLILIEEQKICNCEAHIWKPQKIWNNKYLAERDHIIKNSMYNMVGSYRTVFQITKKDKIHDKITDDHKTVSVFLYLTQHGASFLEVWLRCSPLAGVFKLHFVKYLSATITQAL